jgi:hypothetical protein
MTEIEEPTFGICRGCSEYNVCLGGIHEDCELGYEDYLSSDDVIILVDENSDEKIFHVVERSEDLKMVQDVSKMLKEEHGQENLIRRRNEKYELFTYPIIGNGGDAKFLRGNVGE